MQYLNLPAGEDDEQKVGEDGGEVDHLPRHPHALPDTEVHQNPGQSQRSCSTCIKNHDHLCCMYSN